MNQVLPLAKVYKTGCLTRIFGNSGILKSEHFLKNPHCTIDYAHRQGRTGTFPKTHPQVQYGFETKVIEHSAMPCFLRTMPGKEVVNGGGAQRVRHQCPGRRDEPVDYDGTPMVGAGQDAPCDAPDFEPAHFGQGIPDRSPGFGRFMSIACSTIARFFSREPSSIPVPRPTI